MARTTEVAWSEFYTLLEERSEDYEDFHEYFVGEQDLPVNSAEFRSKFGSFFAEFRDNMARPVIESAEGRVRITEFGDGKGLAADAMKVWRRNRMGKESRWVHAEATVKGDAYVIVLPDKKGKAGIYPQVSESCAILYDEVDPREKEVALKWWVIQVAAGMSIFHPYVRANLYFKDRVERYISTTSSEELVEDFSKFRPYDDEGAAVSKHKVGQVPMFQFSPGFDLSTGRGRSDLADAAPLIDGINKTFLDLFVASEFTAAPQRWATGVEIPLDPKTGEPVKVYESGAERLWTAPNEAARFGQFTAGELTAYKDAITLLVDHLAFITRTPTFVLMEVANFPAGEALRSAEGPLRERAQDHQDDFSPVWTDVIVAALKLDGIAVTEDDEILVAPRWLPVNAPYATREHLEEVKVKAEVAGVPEEMLWRELGYTAEDITEMKEMRAEEAQLGLDAVAEAQALGVVGAPTNASEAVPGGLANDLLPATPDATPPNTATGAPQ